MKFKVYKNSSLIPVYVCFRPSTLPSGNKWVDLDVNIKDEDEKYITVDSPYLFSYAVDELFNVYQVTSTRAITNQKYNLRLLKISFKNIFPNFANNVVTDSAIISSNDVLNNVHKGFIDNYNTGGATVLNVSNLLVNQRAQKVFFQTIQPIESIIGQLSTSFNITGDTSVLTTVLLPNDEKCALGVYTYYYNLGQDSDELLLAFLGSMATYGESLLVNAWVCDSSVANVIPNSALVLDSDNYPNLNATIQPVNPMFEVYKVNRVWDTLDLTETRLLGNEFWKIGENTIIPLINKETTVMELKSFDILGVGTMYRVYYSGEYDDIPKYGNFCIVELGYNNAVAVKSPSLYYQNKQYQVIADLLPSITYTQGIMQGVGTLSLIGKRGAIASASQIVGGVSRGLNADMKNAQERMQFGSLNKTGDVLNLLPFTTSEKVIFRYAFTTSVYDNASVLNSSNAFFYEPIELGDVLYRKYLKCNPLSNILIPEVVMQGVFICRNETDFNTILNKCCG